MSNFQFNETGTKYLRRVPCAIIEEVNGKIEAYIDTYAPMDAFDVRCPARQHAIKKLLCAGIRGKNNELDDLREAEDAIKRAIQMHQAKVYGITPYPEKPLTVFDLGAA
jgi:hypothetical protein